VADIRSPTDGRGLHIWLSFFLTSYATRKNTHVALVRYSLN